MATITLQRHDRILIVEEDDKAIESLQKKGWVIAGAETKSEETVEETVTEEEPEVPKEWPNLSMDDKKDEIIETMESLGLPARSDMTKEALLAIYNEQKGE